MSYTEQKRLTVARTILQQLGGNKAIVMIGMTNRLSGSDEKDRPYLQFDFKRCQKADKCMIILDPSDTYIFKLYKKFDLVCEYTDVYEDMLTTLFEDETGLYLSL